MLGNNSGRFLFSLKEGVLLRKDLLLATSGCLINLHEGHIEFLKGFLELSSILNCNHLFFLNTLSYIETNKKVKISEDKRTEQITKIFPSLNILFSDDGASFYGKQNIIWYVGQEYINHPFKEKLGFHPEVVGNIFFLNEPKGSSRVNLGVKELWNLRKKG